MNKAAELPRTLIEAVKHFSDNDTCVAFVVAHFWPDGEVCCIRCGSLAVKPIKGRPQFRCKDCKYDFSVKVNTIFEKSPLPLSTWLPALWLMGNSKNAISSHELSRALGVTQKTAWFMSHRIREAMRVGTFSKLSGVVEADETFIGGKDKNRHASKKKHIQGHGDTTIVLGMIERGGRPVAKVVDSVKARDLKPEIRKHIEEGSVLYTDKLASYDGLHSEYYRDTVNHSKGQYKKGNAHTNTIENFWSVFKRGLKGTHIHVSPFHLDRYIDDQAFRYTHRKTNDFGRFDLSVSQTRGKRLTWNQLTGKAANAA